MLKEPFEPLTTRETGVLDLLRRGLTNAEIARELDLSEHTVKDHVSAILRKLGAANRHEAAYWPREAPWWSRAPLIAPLVAFLRRSSSRLPFSPIVVGSAAAATVLLAVVGGLALLAYLVLGRDEGPKVEVDGDSIIIPQSAVAALQQFAFTTDLEVEAADGDYGLEFQGVFEQPDRVRGQVHLSGAFDQYSDALGWPDPFEAVIVGNNVSWRDPGGAWQPGVEEGYETLDPLVMFRLYATPWFYLDALHFQELRLPVSGPAERINDTAAVPVRLDKSGIVDVLGQGSEYKRYAEEWDEHEPTFPGLAENAQQVLPSDFEVDIWFAEDDGYPVRIVFDYTIGPDDSCALCWGFEDPLALRLQMDITDPDADVEIEAPIPISTEVPTPTTPPGELSSSQVGRIAEIGVVDDRVQAIIAGKDHAPFNIEAEPWVTSDLKVLGGYWYVDLTEPASYEGPLPSIIYDDTETTDPPFREIEIEANLEDIRRLRVLVYLPEERVVEIEAVEPE